MKILFDPNFIIIKDDMENAVRFDEMFDFLNKYLTENFYLTSELLNNITNFLNPAINSSKQLQDLKLCNIYRLLKSIKIEPIPVNNSFRKLKSFVFSCDNNKNLQQNFVSFCAYLENNNEEVLLFLTDKNIQVKKQINNFYFVLDIYKDLDSSIGKLISEGHAVINSNAIIKPTLQNPLPNNDLCKDYDQVCEELKKGIADKKSVYIDVCKEVALRNGYEKNNKVTKKNRSNNHIRHIFSSKGKDKIYLSADVENGGIEVCNRNGVWQGARSYTGDLITKDNDLRNQNKITAHSIKI